MKANEGPVTMRASQRAGGRGASRQRWIIGLVFLAVLGAAGAALYFWLFAGLPSPENLAHYTHAPSSKIYDRYGRLLFEIPPAYTGNYTPVPLDEIPPALRRATIASEDRSFYEHPGFDLRGILRAVWYTLRGDIQPGGSTITQQLVRNMLLSPEERQERTLRRKLRELVLAVQLTQRYSKDEILEFYLNQIYYGNLAYGVEAAAQTYYGKHVRDLDLAECAMLVAIPQAPALFNPFVDSEKAAERQAIVLEAMVADGAITAEQARLAREERLYFASAPFAIRAPHFVMEVRRQLELTLGQERLEAGGLAITTTLDLPLNETARDIVRVHLRQLAECADQEEACPPGGHNVRNAALVALDPQTGEVLAMLGSPDYFSTGISGAVNGTLALRQPGSAVKPLTYAAALADRAITPATMMLDVRTSFVTREGDSYVPLNYDLQFRGPVRMREALASSYNLIAVKVLDKVGIPALLELAQALGITSWDQPHRLGLAVTLGGGEVRLLELTGAYAAFANGGRAIQPRMILAVTDTAGRNLWPAPAGEPEAPVLDPRVAYLITDILSDDQARIPAFGEGSVLRLGRPAAVKTGTTTDFRDNWTVGYTPELVVGVWAGNADAQPMHEVSGVSGAAPIWHDFMERALLGRPVRTFEMPAGLERAEVCALSGELPGPDCPHRVQELFLEGTAPTETCTMHQRVAIDVLTGERAGSATPADRVVARVFAVLPPEAQSWAREQGWPALPADLAPPATGLAGPTLVMEAPDAGAVYRIDPGLPPDAQRILVAVREETGAALAQVAVWVDDERLAILTQAPYRLWWPLSAGEHHFYAVGTLADGGTLRSAEVTVRVER